MNVTIPDDLTETASTSIVFLVLDGVGGLPDAGTGKTELETANTPNLDRLARTCATGLIEPVGLGITPGSGPGHLGLFGYDPLRWNIGRGVLSALGVGFPLRHGDVAVRLNFASLDESGNVTDRRAGRPSDDENRRLVQKLKGSIERVGGVEVFFEAEKEHRAVLVLRGTGLSADIADTDPQEVGVPPLDPTALSPEAERTIPVVKEVLDRARAVLADEPQANGLLARGFAAYGHYPTFEERFKLRGLAIARYPMYRGVARLLGMTSHPETPETDAGSIEALKQSWGEYDFYFVHVKAVDSRGEDGDFAAKVKAIESIDPLIPEIEALKPDVLVVTGDHSTPSKMRAHSWHPVPLLLVSAFCRGGESSGFSERECRRGELGIFPAVHLMTLALAHAGRLAKFGA